MFGLGKKKVQPWPPEHWNYPKVAPGRTGNAGGGIGQYVPKGKRAPRPAMRPDLALAQRQSELDTVFGHHVSPQDFLRQKRTVQVTPLEVHAHKLSAPGTSLASDSAYVNGKYLIDYSLTTRMAETHGQPVKAAPTILNQPGISDIQIQVINNGLYSQVNANLAGMYLNLRAPGPFEGQQTCN